MKHALIGMIVLASASQAIQMAPPALALPPETLAAFYAYVARVEARMDTETGSANTFLWIDNLPASRRQDVSRRLKRAKAVVEPGEGSGGGVVGVPSALIQHWSGTVFIPGVTLQQTLATLQDYERYPRLFKPVLRAKIVEHQGEFYKLSIRAVQSKIVTTAMDLDTDIRYSTLDSTHVSARGYSTRIMGLRDHDTPQERQRPSVNLWRLNHYARFEERDGGTYLEFEIVCLTRSVPTGLNWAIAPFRQFVGSEFARALEATRSVVLRESSARTRGAS